MAAGGGRIVAQDDLGQLDLLVPSLVRDDATLAHYRNALQAMDRANAVDFLLDDLESLIAAGTPAPSWGSVRTCLPERVTPMSSVPPPLLFNRTVRAVHCVGVAGMGVGPLALYLAARGFRVSGEDDAMTDVMRAALVAGGVTLTEPGQLPPTCDLLVYSSAIAPQHPAQVAATARGIPRARRGEVLAEVTRDRKLVAICGSHGKTTTTTMPQAASRRRPATPRKGH